MIIFLFCLLGSLLVFLSACTKSPETTQAAFTPTIQVSQTATEFNSTIVPTVTETPTPCVETKGSILEQTIPSELLKDSIAVKIYLPPCYSSDLTINYPTLYMLHGQMDTYNQWVSLGLLSRMDSLLLQNQVQPFIIILPNELKTNLDPGRSSYGEALIKEVVPYIEENFRVCIERSCRAIGGLSRGGNWAVRLGLVYPELFSTIGAHSTPLFYGEINNLLLLTGNEELILKMPNFYVDVGDRDPDLVDVQLFNKTLQDLNIPHVYNEYLGYHDDTYWSAHVKDYLLWYSSQLIAPHVY